MAGKKPDYHVCVSERKEGNGDRRYPYRVGAGWVGDKGQINVQIGVPLVLNGNTDLVLFENKDGE
ncbi:MAG TPA: hypothetical protein VGG72_21340 [Bryobacteraceae bacterium]